MKETTLPRRLIRYLLYAVGLCAAMLAGIVVFYAVQTRHRLPALHAWHRVALTGEYSADRGPQTFEAYRKIEDDLFAQVRRRILDDPSAADTHALGRYNPKTAPAALALDTPYNRSWELAPPEPRGAVLLVHGLSDSPYSMRAIAETLYAQGYYVLCLRMPGHGTLPSALTSVSWKDWYGAVAIAAKHAASRAPGKPFLAGGHSTGAALLTLYSVRSLDDPTLPRPERLYLVSPAIGISPSAVLTNVIAGLSFLPRFEKSKWVDVLPEYDPYKYNSFPVNAGKQIHTLTGVLASALRAAAKKGTLGGMPRVTVFQSLVDSTVTASEVVNGLLGLLPKGKGHELVVFDVNRRDEVLGFLAPGPLEALERLKATPDLPYRLTIVGNAPGGTRELAAYRREEGSKEFTETDLPLSWPAGVFSLGHVALPFPPDDPVYGLSPSPDAKPAYPLGTIIARGENGALLVPLGIFGRLRCNPFFEVMRQRIVETAP